MNQEEYKTQKRLLSKKEKSFIQPLLHLLFFFSLTALGITLSLNDNILIFLLGQITLILSFINGQVLVHELGHGFFIPHKKLNHFIGHIVSLSPIIPYKPWVLIHGLHHRWSGNKAKDPTAVSKDYSDLKPEEIKFMNFCWKFWIPIFSLSYSLRVFWNLKLLFEYFPKEKRSLTISVLTQLFVYLSLIVIFPSEFIKVWPLAYFSYLAISEPLLFSQHVHIDQGDITDPEFHSESSYHVREQDHFSRTLIFPKIFEKWILIYFNRHAVHHIYPNLPGYHYPMVKNEFPNTVKWNHWYKLAKKTKAAVLLFKTNNETNLLGEMN